MRTAISIYILIPLILVPQLLLGGAMIKFDDLHKSISKKVYVPIVGDIMVTRWAYEAISVEQFMDNKFEKPFFRYDMEISQNDWYASFLIPALKVKVDACIIAGKNPVYKYDSESNFEKLNFHINDLSSLSGIKPENWMNNLNYNGFNDYTANKAKIFLDSLKTIFRLKSHALVIKRDTIFTQIAKKIGNNAFIKLREENYNTTLADFMLNNITTSKIYDAGDQFIQKADPVFMRPGSKTGRAHFYAPYKQIGDMKFGTLIFNLFIIWIMIFFLFVTLYYNLLKRFIELLESLNLPILRKFGRDLLQFD
jgi:hypothetical protein